RPPCSHWPSISWPVCLHCASTISPKARTNLQDVTRIYRFIGKIFSHPSMLHLGNSISRKKPYFHIIYFIVSVLGKFVLGNAALLAWSLLFYPHLRRPEREKVIFQLSLS